MMRVVEGFAIVLDWILAGLFALAAVMTGFIGVFVASESGECVFWGAGYTLGLAATFGLMAWAFGFAAYGMKNHLGRRWLFQFLPLVVWFAGFTVNYHLFHKPYERCLQEKKASAHRIDSPARSR